AGGRLLRAAPGAVGDGGRAHELCRTPARAVQAAAAHRVPHRAAPQCARQGPQGRPARAAAVSTVLVERRGPVAILTLNRPEHANAFNAELRAEMAAAKDDLAADPSIRVVIVTGAGRHFCGGADLREPRKARAEARRRYPGAADVSTLPQPVIAA